MGRWVPQHRPTKFADKNDQQMKQMNMAQDFFVGPANGWLILQLMTKSGSETKLILSHGHLVDGCDSDMNSMSSLNSNLSCRFLNNTIDSCLWKLTQGHFLTHIFIACRPALFWKQIWSHLCRATPPGKNHMLFANYTFYLLLLLLTPKTVSMSSAHIRMNKAQKTFSSPRLIDASSWNTLISTSAVLNTLQPCGLRGGYSLARIFIL